MTDNGASDRVAAFGSLAAAAPSGSDAIRAEGLSSGYGRVAVLQSVELRVGMGEFVALLGPNGAGKTTLLMTLAGFIRPSAGTVTLLGQTCNRTPPHVRCRRGLTFIGENRNVFPSITVRQALHLAKADDSVFDKFPALRPLVKRRSALLSGGEQQMLALGSALARRPRILMVDELSLGLAPIIRHGLLDMLRQAASGGTAVLVVEQIAKEVLGVADRAYVMRRGEIVDSRPAADWDDHLDELGTIYLS
jgi:branched-chain amino acid transport system ATP-binding protein